MREPMFTDLTPPPSFAEQCKQRDIEAYNLRGKDLSPVQFAIEAMKLNIWASQYKHEPVLLEAIRRLEEKPHAPDTAAEQPITPTALEALGFDDVHGCNSLRLRYDTVTYLQSCNTVFLNGVSVKNITTIGQLKMLITALTKGSV